MAARNDLEEKIHAKSRGYAFGREDCRHISGAQVNEFVEQAVRDVCAAAGGPELPHVQKAATGLIRELATRIYSDPARLENATCYAVSPESDNVCVHRGGGTWEERPADKVAESMLARVVAVFGSLSESCPMNSQASFVPWSVLIREAVRASATDPTMRSRLIGPEGTMQIILAQNAKYLRKSGRIGTAGGAMPRREGPPPFILMRDPSPFEGPFLAAAKDGRTDEALALLEKIPEPWSVRSPHGESALHWAATNDDVRLIAALAAEGLPANVSNNRGVYPLYYAAREGAGRACSKLLELGADPRNSPSAEPAGSPDWVAKEVGLKAYLLGSRFRIENPISKNPALQLAYRVYRWGYETLDRRLLGESLAEGAGGDVVPRLAAAAGSAELTPNWAPRPDLAAESDTSVPRASRILIGEWVQFQGEITKFQDGGFDPSRLCAYCGAIGPDKLKCSRCRVVWFCGEKCQRVAWPLHKALGCEARPPAS